MNKENLVSIQIMHTLCSQFPKVTATKVKMMEQL